ncbi:MAG TPA: MBL fold metallo-hydrolase [Actinophytocola sp.]|uniref:MBL fold metallo-hydrolase n=1 Tax=Actinophytocola sp. TaxID=1872138 RepID=UPI002DB565A8|nr:MBL fold metallo-hydrolase [Actinophytocola sp.]HEU5473629.1 MBL fold metallo-hydrolase [Actinophytocola sp.]
MARVLDVAAGLPATPALVPVAPGVFAYLQEHAGWCVNNSGAVVRADGTMVIDTCATQARTEAQLAAVRALAAPPIDYLINTHFHGDHVFGGCFFPADTRVVAHAETARELAQSGLGLTGLWPDVGWGQVSVRLPDITYDTRLVLDDGYRSVELIHVGPAHTRGDTVVWLPEERVLFAGDVIMSGRTPFLLMGSLSGMHAAVGLLRELRPGVVVPGHGPLGGPGLLDATARYLDWLDGIATAGYRAGLTPSSVAAQANSGEFARWGDPERLVANLHRAYAELDGAVPGAPLDVVSVFAEMVALNGGLPECLA